jgi:competence protein ComEC
MKEKEPILQAYGKSIWCLVSCSVIIFSLVSIFYPRHMLLVSFLDIGQGDSILIQTPSGHTMLVDGGPSDKVLSKLGNSLSWFDNDIDILIATHPDADHVTGLIPVLEKYRVEEIVTSGQTSETAVFADVEKHMNEEHASTHVANTGDIIDFQDGVTATILHPFSGEHFSDTNSASVSLVITYGKETFLLTGDLPSTNEPFLISSHLLPKNITVYKAGHHGSKYSSGEQLLSYIKPEYAVISAGKDNKYGHPNPEAVARLQKYSQEIISTIDSGTITFKTDGKIVGIETEK